MKKIVSLFILGFFSLSGLCSTVFADTNYGENPHSIKKAEDLISNHSKMKCCDENSNQKKITNISTKSDSTTTKQRLISISNNITFWEPGNTIISYRGSPRDHSGIKLVTENVILRE